MNFPSDPVRDFETEQRAVARLGWAAATNSVLSDVTDPIACFKARGHSRYVPTTRTKSAIDAINSSDEAISLVPLDAAFLSLVEGASALSRLRGALRVSLDTVARLQVGSLIAQVVNEEGQKPIARLDFELSGSPSKVAATIIISAEALRSFNQDTQRGVTRLLVQATARTVDEQLVAALIAAAGSAEASADPGDLLMAISNGNPAVPAILASYSDLLTFSSGVLRDLRDLGVEIIPTAAAVGTVIAVDQASLMIAADEGRIEIARHANVVMDDGGSPGSSTVVNLWQKNLLAVRSERMMKFAVPSGAVAYGNVGSP